MSERTLAELQSKSSKGSIKTLDESNFDCNSPRPPVPGQEKAQEVSEWPHPNNDWNKCRSSSPAPRKAVGNDPYTDGYSNGSCHTNTLARPEEVSKHVCNTANEQFRSSDQSPPACLKWAQSLHTLLRDSDGVELFLQYLENEGRQHADVLHFWFACEGLRKQWEPEKVHQLVKVIYKKFFLKSALPISEELRKEIAKNIKSSSCLEPPVTLFDEAQSQLENLINKTTYPNFLKSDIYLQYLQSVQIPCSGSCELSSESSTSSSTRDLGNMASGLGPLPTLHEDMEFVPNPVVNYVPPPGTNINTGHQTQNFNQPVRLTKDMLLISQKHRAVDVRPKSEAFAGLFPYRPMGNLHAAYNSYNPVSRQDSEMQSLSSHSDARTESDNLSLPDSSLVDGGRNIIRSSKRKATLEARHVREWAAANRECQLRDQPLIPRTQRPDARSCAQPMPPEDFAAILTEKLQAVKRDQDLQERLERKLKEGELQDEKIRKSELQSRALANAIKEKLQLEDDNDQDILDQHVSRVFSDLTPCRSPGIVSPRTHSPHRNRYNQVHTRDRSKRRDKDGFSTFSGDSGNIHDFADGSEHRMSMVKSKSMPEYADDRFVRGSAGRRSSSKKTLADLTDSGVSVVSDVPPAIPTTSSTSKDNNRVLAWLLESDRTSRNTSSSGPYSEISQKHRGSHRSGPTSVGYLATSPTAGRHRSKGYSSSRSNSLERAMAASQPAQPFIADPTMPPPPLPNTTIQLEEARRRLMDDDFRNRSRLRSSNKYYPEMSQSVQSTLRKSNRQMRPALPIMHQQMEDFTTVVFTYSDEQFPYRTKIPGNQVTFKQFKEYLPKKGNYRYFFKTVCEELGNQVIQEEVNRDTDILPLWEGKIMAQAKPID